MGVAYYLYMSEQGMFGLYYVEGVPFPLFYNVARVYVLHYMYFSVEKMYIWRTICAKVQDPVRRATVMFQHYTQVLLECNS